MEKGPARRFRVSGRVQGVGFRYSTQLEAHRLGLSGWVRNCRDGTVEAIASGDPASLDAFHRWLQQGPPGARVKELESLNLEGDELTKLMVATAGFEILR